jgi:hypothetical protein
VGNNNFEQGPENPEREPSVGYQVGYKRPPRRSRFVKGQSGNPKGRPRGVKNLRTEVIEEMQQKITVREGDRSMKVTKVRALLKSMTNKALKGDVRAMRAAVDLYQSYTRDADNEVREPDLSGDEAQLLELLDEEALRKRTVKAEAAEDGEEGGLS